jgi:hypothetical protein
MWVASTFKDDQLDGKNCLSPLSMFLEAVGGKGAL